MATKSIRLTDGTDTLLPESAESGTYYTKMADGTLICRGSVVLENASAGTQKVSVTFPMAFSSPPTVLASPFDTENFPNFISDYGVVQQNTTATGTQIYAKRIGSGYAWRVAWLAIGRWK